MALLAIACVVAGAAFLCYALLVYPALLGLAARLRPAPEVRKDSLPRSVSLLLPVHDGAGFLRRKLESILALDYPREKFEVIVLADGCRDASEEIARSFAAQGVKLLSLARCGKASALNAGAAASTGEILFFTDVRQPLDPACLRNLVAPFADPEVGAVSGDVVLRDLATGHAAPMGLYWRYEAWMRRQLSRAGSMVVVAGALWAMRRSLFEPLPAGVVGDDALQPSRLILRGCRVVLEETARSYDYPTALDAEFNRKVRTLAGLIQVVRLLPALLTPANPMLAHFLSYKISRLLMPYALLLIAAGTALGLPARWAAAAAAAQAAFYLAALLDPWMPPGSLLKRLTSPARTFLVLMAASLCAALTLFRPLPSAWKATGVEKQELG
jgi:cellulose synthase/poly-beta-1,6-N-acetylglucosamine synthase-like glycosyltransferase